MQKTLKNGEIIIKNSEDYKNYLNLLKTLSKNEIIEDVERHKRIINSNQEIIGISMKNIRDVAKNISKNSKESFLKLAGQKTVYNSYYEETLIEGLVLAEEKDLEKQFLLLKEWSKKIDNWSTCDSVVTTLKGLKKSKEKDLYFEKYKSLCFDKNEFVSRFGIVVLMSCYLEEHYIDAILETMKNIKNRAYYVDMAIAWLISMAFVINEKKVYDLLKDKTLDKFIQNKAISKCRDSFRVSQENKEKLKMLKM